MLSPCFSVGIRASQAAAPLGNIELLTLSSRVFSNTRTIRVWLPPGYSEAASSKRTYPVFYFTDGVAVFHARQLDRIAGELIAARRMPAVIFVGIDNGGSTRESKSPGTDRANEYLPFPDQYLQPPLPTPHGKEFPAFFENEVRPLVERRYRTNGKIGLAGSSYGAVIALYSAMQHPKGFRWLLLESPSLYVDNDALLKTAANQRDWPDRVYIGAGTEEGEGDAKREMVDDVKRLKQAIGQGSHVCSVIVDGAQHNEDAWRARLPFALQFLLGGKLCHESRQLRGSP
ncbi:MAG: alpha/beta hydrolase [Acidobacteria bacterium]|nr:alpha/beta hydrolase [Acidobacteriota bacterium]